jgi:CheY-like chemotaxis protein
VLVVEDNPAMRKMIVLQLRALNYRVIEASSVPGALEVLENNAVQVVFSDIIMPGGSNGIDLFRATLARWPQVRFVLSSGFADPKILNGLGSAGNVRVLVKPFRKAELAREIRSVLGP